MAADKPGRLTLEEVLRLQRELYAAYSDDDFQGQLEELEARHGKAYRKYTPEHTRLFLTVQDRILPKYGFAEGQRGAVQMLDDVKRFNGNETFEQNRLELNRLIGLAPEADDEAPPAPAAPAPAPAAPARPPARGPPRPADGPEPEPPAITEMLRWQPQERRSLLPAGAAGAAGAPADPGRPVAAPGAGRSGPARAGAPAPAPAGAPARGAAPAPGARAGGPQAQGAPAAADAGEDIGAWLKSLEGGSLAMYEPFVRRLVSKTSEIKRSYPLLQDFFQAVPVNDPNHRQLFARAIRTLP